MNRVLPIQLCSWSPGFNSVRSDIFIETTVTTRPSSGGATFFDRAKNMPLLRSLRFFVLGIAINMSLLTELGLASALRGEVKT